MLHTSHIWSRQATVGFSAFGAVALLWLPALNGSTILRRAGNDSDGSFSRWMSDIFRLEITVIQAQIPTGMQHKNK